jgi:hypothetical protein
MIRKVIAGSRPPGQALPFLRACLTIAAVPMTAAAVPAAPAAVIAASFRAIRRPTTA